MQILIEIIKSRKSNSIEISTSQDKLNEKQFIPIKGGHICFVQKREFSLSCRGSFPLDRQIEQKNELADLPNAESA